MVADVSTEDGAAPQGTPVHHFQIVSRVGSIPVVATAVEQLGTLYGYTKTANPLLKYGLEKAEYGLRIGTNMAAPVVNKFEKPVSTIDQFAVSQLNKLEQHLPIISKPTPVVMAQAGQLYELSLKPTVERLQYATQYGLQSFEGVKNISVSYVNGVKTYTFETLDGVKHRIADITVKSMDKVSAVTQLSMNKVESLSQYSKDTVSAVTKASKDTLSKATVGPRQKAKDITHYGYSKVQDVTTYSMEKALVLLNTPYGKTLTKTVDNFVNTTEEYVDYYLPEDDEAENEEVTESEKKEEKVTENDHDITPMTTASRVTSLTARTSQRLYKKSMKQLSNLKMRTAEVIGNLNYTVNLIEYGKSLDGKLADGYMTTSNKMWSVWEEINKSEEQVIKEQEAGDVEDQPGLEKRMIMTARHLTNNLKNHLKTVSSATQYLPQPMIDSYNHAVSLATQLAGQFSQAQTLSDIKEPTLKTTRGLMTEITTLSSQMYSYVYSLMPSDKLKSYLPAPTLPDSPTCIEMEALPQKEITPSPQDVEIEGPNEDKEKTTDGSENSAFGPTIENAVDEPSIEIETKDQQPNQGTELATQPEDGLETKSTEVSTSENKSKKKKKNSASGKEKLSDRVDK